MNPEAYFKLHDLYNKENLLQHAEHNLVKVIQSKKYPNLVMLHYADEASYDKHWTTFNRMCRGLIVDLENKQILAHPFDKFFNVGEMPETSYETLNEEGPFSATEKLDGSMLILFQDPNTKQFVLTTKGSFDSEHGEFATKLLPDCFKWEVLVRDYTFVFELISTKFQIVIDYKKKGYREGLYLIGMRHRISNKFLSYKEMKGFRDALKAHVSLPKTFEFATLDDVIANTKQLTVLDEGYVLRFKSTDKLVKIKGTEYLRVHRFKSRMSPKYLLEALMVGNENEMIDFAPEEYKDDVTATIKHFKRRRLELINQVYSHFAKAPKDTRKNFAMWVNSNVEPYLKGFMFMVFDHKPLLPETKLYKVVGELENVSGETVI